MKKGIPFLLMLCLLFSCSAGAAPEAAAAGSAAHTVVLKIDSPWCAVGESITMVDPANPEVAPVIVQDRTLLPIRMILESFGGSVGWDETARQVTCALGGHSAVLTVDAPAALVDGVETPLDVPAIIRNDRTLTPVRFVSEHLGLRVEWMEDQHLVVISDRELPENLSGLSEVQALLDALSRYGSDPLSLVQSSFSLPSGTVQANVVTVDLSNPRVRVEARQVDGQIDHTAAFSAITAESGADVVINGNFFNFSDLYKPPVGSMVSNGNFLSLQDGLASLGFDGENRTFWGSSSFAELTLGSETVRSDSINNPFAVEGLYTPAYGSTVAPIFDSWALTAAGGRITAYSQVSGGTEVPIPSDGFVFLHSGSYRTGDTAAMSAWITAEDGNDYRVTQMISGEPRLIKNGQIVTELTPSFDGAGFTTLPDPRTAVGTTGDGRLILVNTPSASIQQLRELMSELGCENAVNLQGGASAAMYYQGQILCDAGRELTTTLHIFVDA